MADKPSYDELELSLTALEAEIADLRRTAADGTPAAPVTTELILQNIQSGVLVIDCGERRIVDLNPAAESMIGAPRDEVIGRVCHDFVCSAEEGHCPVLDQRQTVSNLETLLHRADGGSVDILKTAIPVDINGRPCLLESFIDITDRKRAEAEAQAHLDRFRTFFSSVNDTILVHPLLEEGFAPFVEVNDFACRSYGYTREEFLKLTAKDITKKAQVDAHATPGQRRALLEQRRKVFEAVHIRKSGEEFPVEISSNIVEQYGRPVILSVVRDITERKEAEAERVRIEWQQRQSQKVEAIGRLAGGVAHDLNNMLTPVLGFGELLREDLPADDERQESVENIIKAGSAARDLVQQLLAFGRKQTLTYRALDVNVVVTGLEQLLRHTLRENIDLMVACAPSLRAVRADVGQIEQVVMNLALNAQDAMPQGGKMTIETSMVDLDAEYAANHPGSKVGPHVMVAVTDTGCGMAAETQEHIFEPFFSTKGEQGTGLGLATLYGIVNQHGGSIWLYSEPDRGTTFKVYLPAVDEAPQVPQDDPGAALDLVGTETILLVEDNQQVLGLSRQVLEKQGYRVLGAAAGLEALQLLESHDGRVDLLLTDVVMPDMNGRQLYERIAAVHPDMRVLYMSGYTKNVIAHHGVLQEGIRFIQKPFTIRDLAKRVRETLENRTW